MAVNVAASSMATRRGVVFALLAIAIAAAVGIAVFRSGMLAPGSGAGNGNFAKSVGNGVANVKALGQTVADLLGGRSPGERAQGILASLKHKRLPLLHERALPKIRRPGSPLAAIVGAPEVPPAVIPPAATPLYNVVNAAPAAPGSEGPLGSPGGTSGIVFPGLGSPGGGGGGIFVPPPETPVTPPVVTPPVVTPPIVTPPTNSAVPEPTSWAMMLIGFVLIGGTARRHRKPTEKLEA